MIVRPVGSTPVNLVGAERLGKPRFIPAGSEAVLDPIQHPKLIGQFPGVKLGATRGEDFHMIGASSAEQKPFVTGGAEGVLAQIQTPKLIGVGRKGVPGENQVILGAERAG